MKAKYLDPFTGLGFKRLFRQDASTPQPRYFLNALLLTAQTRQLAFEQG